LTPGFSGPLLPRFSTLAKCRKGLEPPAFS
jgi:hypothetical protein